SRSERTVLGEPGASATGWRRHPVADAPGSPRTKNCPPAERADHAIWSPPSGDLAMTRSALPLAALLTAAAVGPAQPPTLPAAPPDGARLDPAHLAMDRTVEALLAAIDQVGVPTPELARAIARAKYADEQLHLALAGGDAAPDAAGRRAIRLADAAGDQVE